MSQYTPSNIITIHELAMFLRVPEGRLREALAIHAVEKTKSGATAITGRMVLRLLERAVDLEMHLPPPGDWVAPAEASPKRRKGLPASVRAAIVERDGGRCRYCGHKGNGYFHIDHLISVRYGGGDDEINLVTACAPCNARKRTGTAKGAGLKLRWCDNRDERFNLVQRSLADGDLTPLYPEAQRAYARKH